MRFGRAAVAAAQQPEATGQPQFAQPLAGQPPAGPPVAAPPQYLFLAPSYHAYGQFVPAQAYAYGWFGVCGHPHAVLHWDYFDHRWIWWR